MRIASVESQGSEYVVLEHEGDYYPWKSVMGGEAPASMLDVLPSLLEGRAEPVFDHVEPLPGPFQVLAPFVPPRNVICIGKNYADHADEFSAFAGQDVVRESVPVVFTKSPSAICAPFVDVHVHPDQSMLLDYEVELAVVIGAGGHRIPAEDAHSHVAGYSILNDLTDRDAQLRQPQWFLAKSVYRTSAFGPVVVTVDELPSNPRLTTEINGEVRQDARVSQMLVGVPRLIEFISQYIELMPGDVIATGTPSGVGIGSVPPRCITDGLVVTCTIEGIGSIENRFHLDAGAVTPTLAGAGTGGEHEAAR
jgi:2-keto-4-pentenoate hydratase/2-oxohepta-3-ene-1,7-dioic acid hydratase in catechol pathway